MYKIAFLLLLIGMPHSYGEVVDTYSLCVLRTGSNSEESLEIANVKSEYCNFVIRCQVKEGKIFIGGQCKNGKSYYYLGLSQRGSYISSVRFLNDKILFTNVKLKDEAYYSSQLMEGKASKSPADENETLNSEFKDRFLFFDKSNERLAYRKIEPCKRDSLKFFKRCFSSNKYYIQ